MKILGLAIEGEKLAELAKLIKFKKCILIKVYINDLTTGPNSLNIRSGEYEDVATNKCSLAFEFEE